MRAVPWLLLSAGAVLLIIGIATGQAADVMRQAVTVCLECIGIG